ncbi:MAG: hypothetical protein U9N50_10605 [Pseudomonadota bacterium]|nr:hypothetical protein [Pseudomonadota bacterium]
MFVRVKRKDIGLHFTVVDILRTGEEGVQELDLILDLGVIRHGDLNGEQSWYVIAENLIASDLAESEKVLLARDIANWLPPLSRNGLLKAREEDLRQLSALCANDSPGVPAIPADLNENDPLTIIADWLEID